MKVSTSIIHNRVVEVRAPRKAWGSYPFGVKRESKKNEKKRQEVEGSSLPGFKAHCPSHSIKKE